MIFISSKPNNRIYIYNFFYISCILVCTHHNYPPTVHTTKENTVYFNIMPELHFIFSIQFFYPIFGKIISTSQYIFVYMQSSFIQVFIDNIWISNSEECYVLFIYVDFYYTVH